MATEREKFELKNIFITSVTHKTIKNVQVYLQREWTTD